MRPPRWVRETPSSSPTPIPSRDSPRRRVGREMKTNAAAAVDVFTPSTPPVFVWRVSRKIAGTSSRCEPSRATARVHSPRPSSSPRRRRKTETETRTETKTRRLLPRRLLPRRLLPRLLFFPPLRFLRRPRCVPRRRRCTRRLASAPCTTKSPNNNDVPLHPRPTWARSRMRRRRRRRNSWTRVSDRTAESARSAIRTG